MEIVEFSFSTKKKKQAIVFKTAAPELKRRRASCIRGAH